MNLYMNNNSDQLISDIKRCEICEARLPNPPRPILQFSQSSAILIIGQAPGIKAHDSRTPWNDASGERLRAWLGINKNTFYDAQKVALMPMGFCYPGKGQSGDLPPTAECAPQWHEQLISKLPLHVTFLIGQYAQNYYLKDKLSVTKRVQNWREYQPDYFVLPHPSPRNNIWLKRNSWFEQDVIPEIRRRVASLLPSNSSN